MYFTFISNALDSLICNAGPPYPMGEGASDSIPDFSNLELVLMARYDFDAPIGRLWRLRAGYEPERPKTVCDDMYRECATFTFDGCMAQPLESLGSLVTDTACHDSTCEEDDTHLLNRTIEELKQTYDACLEKEQYYASAIVL